MYLRKSMIIIFSFLLTSISSNAYGDTGRYAVLLFGGGTFGTDSGSDDSLYVHYEIAHMYEILLNQYNFPNNQIYIHNLNAEKKDTVDYYHYIEDINTPTYYRRADTSETEGLRKTFLDLNSLLNANSDNIVLLYISGHQGKTPVGSMHYYQFYQNLRISDSTFCQLILNDLLEGQFDVNSKTKMIIIAGFCGAYGFWDDIDCPYYELMDACDNVSFAVADCVKSGNVAAGPEASYMAYWREIVGNDTTIKFDDAWEVARDTLYARKDWTHPYDDIPYKSQVGNWDDDFTLNGLAKPNNPTSLSVSGSSVPRAYLTWTDNADNEDGFKIERKVNDGSWSVKATISANTTSYYDYDITNGYTYQYRVRAYRTLSGWTSYSGYTDSEELPLICWIYGPYYLEFKQSGTFYARRAGYSGTPSYQWWKSFDQQNWSSIGSSSSVNVTMATVTFYLKLRAIASEDTVYDYHTVYYGMPKTEEQNVEEMSMLPLVYRLGQNRPNPFNPQTTIHYALPEAGLVRIDIFNIRGQKIVTLVDRDMPAGYHQATFDAARLPSGIYFYRLTTGNFSDIKRMVLMK